MNFDVSEEQQLLQETVRQFVDNECPLPRLREIFDGDVGHDPVFWEGLAEMGIAGLQVSEEFGGAGLELIDLALQRIPHQHWMKIFERQLSDLRNNRSGFPDLVVFPPESGYLLVEVKGPGDTLQKNQQRWMQYFGENDIPHLLARVSWQAEN